MVDGVAMRGIEPKRSPSGAINFTTFVASGGRTHRDSLCGARMAGSGQAPDSDVIFPTMASERTQRQIDRLVDEARVSAGVVQTGADLADDPQLNHRGFLRQACCTPSRIRCVGILNLEAILLLARVRFLELVREREERIRDKEEFYW